MIKATGYLFDRIAYISDCNKINKKVSRKLMNFSGMIETGMKTILRLFFDGLNSKNQADLIQSNLR